MRVGKETEVPSMYVFDTLVRYSEVDHTNHLTLPAMVNYFQDIAEFESAQYGLDWVYYHQRNQGWMLSSWQIELERRPKKGEKIQIGTYPYACSKLFVKRNFYVADESGKTVIRGNSEWFLMDLEKERPIRVPSFIEEKVAFRDPLPMHYENRKIVLPEKLSFQEVGKFTVTSQHLDSNQHLNNYFYIRQAMATYAEAGNGEELSNLRIEYLQQGFAGDVVISSLAQDHGKWYVKLQNQHEMTLALIILTPVSHALCEEKGE